MDVGFASYFKINLIDLLNLFDNYTYIFISLWRLLSLK